jgi:hypothetical protein
MSKHTSKTYSIFSHLGYCPECGAKEDPTKVKAQRDELLEALKNLEKEFRQVYPIYYYAEPWGHESNVPLQAARAVIAKATGEQA